MSVESTIRFAEAYKEETPPANFLSSHFRTPPKNFFPSTKVKYDVKRSGREVAIAIVDAKTGRRLIEQRDFSSKEFEPPKFELEYGYSEENADKREFGETAYDDPDFMENAMRHMQEGMREAEGMIDRAIELMCSEVLQNATVTLRDQNGVVLGEVFDFNGKSSHFPTVGTDWGTGTEDKNADLRALCDQVRIDGKMRVDRAVFGETALDKYLSDADVIARLDTRRIDMGNIQLPEQLSTGTYHGRIAIGNQVVEVWSYDETYVDPSTGVETPYVDPDNVIVLATKARRDLYFGAIRRIVPPEPRLAGLYMGRVSNNNGGAGGRDLSTNVWAAPDGSSVRGSAGTRPLPVPTAIDCHGTLKTVA